MAMEKMDHMKEALSARRGKGLDAIMSQPDHAPAVMGTDPGEHEDAHTGQPHEESVNSSMDYKRSDLAPAPESSSASAASRRSGEGQHQSIQDAVVGGQHEMAPGDVHTNDDTRSHLMGNLSEVDLRDMSNRKPRSLMERARKEAYAQKKQ